MEVSRIIAEIDAQIAKLRQARELLAGTIATTAQGTSRPKSSRSAKSGNGSGKRRLTPEGRKRIADAMKRRWAERRKMAAKNNLSAK